MGRFSKRIETPDDFQLRTVVFSHGWFDLPPYHWDADTGILGTSAAIEGRPVAIQLQSSDDRTLTIEAHFKGRGTKRLEAATIAVATNILGLDKDVGEFFRLSGRRFAWARRIGAGRLLRAPTAFEDAVKMLATTNCSWSLTRAMMSRLVEELGDVGPDGRRLFPTPEAMADQSVAFYKDRVRAGYRSPSMREFAQLVAKGSVEPETWPFVDGSTEDLIAQITALRGFGRYAAENLCKLFGRFDFLGLDSWCLKKYAEMRGPQEDVAKAIRDEYEPFGRWKGLALWLELTRDWHEEDAYADRTTGFAKS